MFVRQVYPGRCYINIARVLNFRVVLGFVSLVRSHGAALFEYNLIRDVATNRACAVRIVTSDFLGLYLGMTRGYGRRSGRVGRRPGCARRMPSTCATTCGA
jgi:hypothetical protein